MGRTPSRINKMVAVVGIAVGGWFIYRLKHKRTQSPVVIPILSGLFGKDVFHVHANQPVRLTWAWETSSRAYAEKYIQVATFELEVDGSPVPLPKATLRIDPSANTFVARWTLEPLIFERGAHQLRLIGILSQPVSDGFDANNDGLIDFYGPYTERKPAIRIIVG